MLDQQAQQVMSAQRALAPQGPQALRVYRVIQVRLGQRVTLVPPGQQARLAWLAPPVLPAPLETQDRLVQQVRLEQLDQQALAQL